MNIIYNGDPTINTNTQLVSPDYPYNNVPQQGDTSDMWNAFYTTNAGIREWSIFEFNFGEKSVFEDFQDRISDIMSGDLSIEWQGFNTPLYTLHIFAVQGAIAQLTKSPNDSSGALILRTPEQTE